MSVLTELQMNTARNDLYRSRLDALSVQATQVAVAQRYARHALLPALTKPPLDAERTMKLGLKRLQRLRGGGVKE